ncbi:MAG: hypothetical protein ACRC0C_13290 [Gibbsiella quercinecans]
MRYERRMGPLVMPLLLGCITAATGTVALARRRGTFPATAMLCV